MDLKDDENMYERYRYIGKEALKGMIVPSDIQCKLLYNSNCGELITFNNKPKCYNALDISDIRELDSNISENMARYSLVELGKGGLLLPANMNISNKQQLIASYMLNTCLCYVEVSQNEYFLATKNLDILNSFLRSKELICDTELWGNIGDEIETTYEELVLGDLNILGVCIIGNQGRIIKTSISIANKNTIVIPFYSIYEYAGSITKQLRQNKLMIKYEDNDGEEKMVISTLDSEYLKDWFRDDMKYVEAQKILKGVPIPTWKLSQIRIPDIGTRGEFVNINIFRIKDVRRL